MSRRPDPAQFAQYSYILAVISSGILTLALLMGIIPNKAINDLGGMIVWLVFLSGSIGAFMGYTAKVDLRAQTSPEELIRKARTGFRINLIALVATFLLAVLAIGATLLMGSGQ